MIRYGKPRSPLPDGRFLDDFEDSDSNLEWAFLQWRWPESNGEPVCPNCGYTALMQYHTRKLFKCYNCEKQFSNTSGTLLAYHKIAPEVAAFIAASLSIDPSHQRACELAAAFELCERGTLSTLRLVRAVAGASR